MNPLVKHITPNDNPEWYDKLFKWIDQIYEKQSKRIDQLRNQIEQYYILSTMSETPECEMTDELPDMNDFIKINLSYVCYKYSEPIKMVSMERAVIRNEGFEITYYVDGKRIFMTEENKHEFLLIIHRDHPKKLISIDTKLFEIPIWELTRKETFQLLNG
ncbi:MAG: hypothetical protein WC284_08715 [Candidimonas sp.]